MPRTDSYPTDTMLVVTLPERSGRTVGGVEHAVSARTAALGARRASRMTAVALAALALLLVPGSLVLDALTGQNLAENGAQDIIVFASAVTVGLVLAWHRPGNAIGWLLLVVTLPERSGRNVSRVEHGVSARTAARARAAPRG